MSSLLLRAGHNRIISFSLIPLQRQEIDIQVRLSYQNIQSVHTDHKNKLCKTKSVQYVECRVTSWKCLANRSKKNLNCQNDIKAALLAFGISNFFQNFFDNICIIETKNSLSFTRNEYAQLLMKYQPLNLGHGCTDYAVPKYITDALAATANSTNYMLNQYTRGFVSWTICFIFIYFSFIWLKVHALQLK